MSPDESGGRVRGEVSPGLFVRPVNYVAARPVIRRLGDRDCYLGNVHAADPELHELGVIYLAAEG